MACEIEKRQSDEAARAALNAGNNQTARYEEYKRELESASDALAAAGLAGLITVNPAALLAGLTGVFMIKFRPLANAAIAARNAENAAEEAERKRQEAFQAYKDCLNKNK